MTTRRNFLRLVGSTAAGGVISQYGTEIARAFEQVAEGDMEVVWFQGQSCTGCTISTLQAQYPTLEEALNEFRLEVTFHPTIMPEAGEAAIESMSMSPDILIVEGSIPTDIPEAATIGGRTAEDWVTDLAPQSDIIVSVGNCAAFGGWPAAENKKRLYDLGENVTGAKGLQFEKRKKGGVLGADFTGGAGLPVVNLGGCPPNPDYVLLTLATVLNGHVPELDEYNRPLPFYEPLVHDNCMHRGYFDRGEFADKPGGEGCLLKQGCKGPYTHCDDQTRLWNDGTSVCLNVSAPCIGCMEPGFWDRFSPFQQEMEGSPVLGNVSATQAGAVGVAAAAAGIGAHLGRRAMGYGKFESAEKADAETKAAEEDTE
ncbi:Ni/Fe-hydrogenase small subunit [Halodesulfurarchaeum formicicum]|uniref:Ni/Fe-hydrogenase small subunit n=1 Tax=Halodesulfurarchaeum formicicum TaxID=1873524 RepID=A0A1D8S3E0_9EURY|nr:MULTISPECIES: twin-arginine translocation signal domain-containing protein [Halodesulfurarchaeum]AOW79851.1 Ni/Fe-hydrogenase small subunit [Halodesulfurarchaeum formicicum]APE95144.1 Ni/Fe-hydrogenase small subunit [Halodesulfurarchaeum formicicum]MDR5657569.1 twin-arginine translocation signal domain-containing protein [Halodesulfurarchaeum sp. HSR-GB]